MGNPITQVGAISSATVAAGASSLGLTWPSGIRAGDVAEVFHIHNSVTNPSGPPSGFTAGVTANSGGASPTVRHHWDVCTGSESGALSVPNAGTVAAKAWLRVWRGIDPLNPILMSDSDGTGSSVSSLTSNLDTGTLADCLLSYAVGMNTSTGAWTPPSGFTEDFENLSTPDSSGGFRIWSGAGAIAITPVKASTAARGAQVAIAYRPLQFAGWGIPI